MKNRTNRALCLLVTLALLTTSLWATGSPVSAQDPAPAAAEPVVVRLYVRDKEHLDAVAGELDIWETHPEESYVVAAVKPAEYQWLQGLGYRLEIDAEKTELLGIRAPLDPRFHYFDDYYTNPNGNYMVDFLQNTNAAYSDLTDLIDIGNAWLGEVGGDYNRDIWVLRITNEDALYGPIEDKPAFYLFGGIHPREAVTPELVIRYIKYLTEGYNGEGGYGIDPDVTWLVNHNVIYLQVSQNPDGHWKIEEDINNSRRKNMDSDDGCNDPSSWGVDLARNHSFFWGCCGGSSGYPCNPAYRGPAAASEPETQAFQTYFATVIEDQNGPNGDNELPPAAPITTTGIFLTLHQYGDQVLWPWAVDDHGDPPNVAGLTTIGRKLAYYADYDPLGSIGYEADGTTHDWTYGKFGVPSFAFEIAPDYGNCGGFFPDYECIDGEPGWPENFWADNKPAFLFAHKIARTPYMTAYGPDAGDVAVVPGAVAPGTLVDLTATVEDHRYTGDPLQPIYGAEYFVDAPGEDGAGTPMSPSDGSWGGLSEDVEAMADTTGWASGQHYILVHGLNDDGDWGPLTAVLMYIVEPVSAEFASNSPVTLGNPVVFTNLTTGTTPIEYWWDFGDGTGISTESDPEYTYLASGTYTVTLVATNTVGSDSVEHPVVVLPDECVDLSEIAVAGDTAGVAGTYTFTTSYEPPDASPPITYTWDNGGAGAVSVRALDVGTYTLVVTATNCVDALVTDTHTIIIGEPGFYIYLPLVIKDR
jgi:carboxypeptidase T